MTFTILIAIAVLWRFWRLNAQWWAYRARSQRVRAGFTDEVEYRKMWR